MIVHPTDWIRGLRELVGISPSRVRHGCDSGGECCLCSGSGGGDMGDRVCGRVQWWGEATLGRTVLFFGVMKGAVLDWEEMGEEGGVRG
ncbi:hypothetical protein Tco_0598895 [Tanacetum coccineum]